MLTSLGIGFSASIDLSPERNLLEVVGFVGGKHTCVDQRLVV